MRIPHRPEEEADAHETAALIGDGVRVVLHAADRLTPQATRELAERAVSELGGVDALVCNAAFQMAHEDLSDFPPSRSNAPSLRTSSARSG